MGEEIEKKFLDVLYSKIQDCVKEEKVWGQNDNIRRVN
jgi:hypothetical protein